MPRGNFINHHIPEEKKRAKTDSTMTRIEIQLNILTKVKGAKISVVL